MMRFSLRPEIVLILITMIWGGTFLAVQIAVQNGGPLYFVALRFGLGAMFLAIIARPNLRGTTSHDLKGGLWIGLSIALGYGLQTIGLMSITSSKSAFITAAAVPLVPVFQWIILGQPPKAWSILGLIVAFVGLMMVVGPEAGGLAFSQGEVLTLFCAVAVALEVVLISRFATQADAKRITVIQMAAASGMALIGAMILQEPLPEFTWTFVGLAIALAAASTIIQIGMNWAQRTVSPTRATIIYTGEPVYAGILGRIVGERLPPLAIFGGVLILIAVLISELGPRLSSKLRQRKQN